MPASTPDYYSTLGVSKDASQDEIKKAFRKLARKHHPDAGGDESKFKEINEAYEVLSDEEKRRVYDQFGSASSPYGATGTSYAYGSGASAYGGGFADWADVMNSWRTSSGGAHVGASGFDDFGGSGFGGFSDIFSDIFGATGAGGVGGTSAGVSPGFSSYTRPVNLDVTAEMSIPLQELVKGEKKTITLTIDGKKKTLKISIPKQKGTSPTVRIKGQGKTDGENTGDLILTLKAIIPDDMEVRGSDIYSIIDIPFPVAVCGGKVDTVLPSGKKVKVNVPASTDSGKTFTVSGEGVKAGGKCVMRANITVPKNLSTDEIAEIAKIKERLGE